MKLENLIWEQRPLRLEFDGRYINYKTMILCVTENETDTIDNLVLENYDELTSLSPLGINAIHQNCQIQNCRNFTDLESLPSAIGGHFTLSFCDSLSSLHGINSRLKKVGGGINIIKTDVKSNVLGLLMIEIGKSIYLNDAHNSDEIHQVQMILNKHKNMGRKGVLAAHQEMISLGLTEYAQI